MLHINRKRINKPMFSSIEFGNYKMDGLTVNNIILCDNVDTVKYITESIMTMLDKDANRVIMGLWDKKLLDMTDEEFNKALYDSDKYLDNLFIEINLDEITVQFRDYAIQKFIATTTPEVLYRRTKAEDVWYANNLGTVALTEFKGYKAYNKNIKGLIQAS